MKSLHVICGLAPPPQSKILATPLQLGLSEREIGWFKLILQLQTAQCQMFITINSTLIYF